MIKILPALVVAITPVAAMAAVPASKSTVAMALKLPFENRMSALKQQGGGAIKNLEEIAFSPNQNLQSRWRAITAIGQFGPKQSQPILAKALESKQWFMRNAATVALVHSDRSWALKKAKVLLDDPALVVRTAAVNAISKHNGSELSPFLWHKLYSAENYRNGKSLWVRRHIAKALVEMGGAGDEPKFIGLLKDKDESLHALAIQGLEKIMKHKTRAKDLKEKRRVWLAWWSRYS
ncbi:MAG: HEAT repeat domain-containing protein [Pseudobdellovibrionaceae bacterium]|nr:HEAT repeat domain-containing protein [Bdellovibrionales bacterium]USN48821.1 MAG: HEAT repeat domain-containing protein [Pseudobdellovibrionaceae bacterium]